MNRVAAALILAVMGASVVVRAQDPFVQSYTKGVEAFRNGDYQLAEQLLRASINSGPAGRGPHVHLVSQQYGFCPEAYLALVYRELRRYDDVLKYVDTGMGCESSWKDVLVNAKNAAKRAQAEASQAGEHDSGPSTPVSAETGIGPMYALVIGINDYGGNSGLPKLSTAVADAKDVSAELHDDFGFEPQLLLNAKRKDIIAALDGYSDIPVNSSLLVYYAGHGDYNKRTDKAAWLPSDADLSETPNWIWSDELLNSLKAIPARHILVLSDSCYSGAMLTRSARPKEDTSDYGRYVEKQERVISRDFIASGRNEAVSDSGGGGHSVFAAAFLKGLREIDHGDFTASNLFQQYISIAVSAETQQSPVYSPILPLIDQQGDFVFHRRKR